MDEEVQKMLTTVEATAHVEVPLCAEFGDGGMHGLGPADSVSQVGKTVRRAS